MCTHEEKHCPRCGVAFECKVGDITHCQCYGIGLSAEEKAFLEGRYEDCLCRNCLLELKSTSRPDEPPGSGQYAQFYRRQDPGQRDPGVH